jgi:hypothetical protein
MRRLFLLFTALPLLTHAQQTVPAKGTPEAAKTAPLSSAAPILDKPGEERMTWNYTGTFEIPPTHPACGDMAGEPRKACTAEHVLAEIKSRLKAVPPTTKPPASVMINVDFDVNAFGEVKQITVDYAGDPVLANQIIVALYGLPKFIPANNAGARAPSHCSFAYAPSLLFEDAPAK